jgi:hypothetical protein
MAKRPSPSKSASAPLTAEQVDAAILVIRGHKILLDEQLAAFYGVETKALVQATKRNIDRFPPDFMFQLSREEWVALRSQVAEASLRSQSVTLKSGRGQHRKYAPYAYTEQGVAMLSSVLRSVLAVQVNIEIMRAFVRIRQLLSAHKELAERIEKLERQMSNRDANTDQQFRHVFALLEQLFTTPKKPRQPIGFHARDVESK